MIHFHQRGVERQNHEGNVAIHHADHERKLGEHHAQRCVDDADPHQELVDQAVDVEQVLPGVDADEERRPERQHDQHQQGGPYCGLGTGDEVGKRIADDQTQHCGHQRVPQRRQIGDDVEAVAHQRHVGREVNVYLQRIMHIGDDRIEADTQRIASRHADLEQDEKRRQQKGQQPDLRNADHDLAAPVEGLAHFARGGGVAVCWHDALALCLSPR